MAREEGCGGKSWGGEAGYCELDCPSLEARGALRGAEKALFWIFDCGYLFFHETHKNNNFGVFGFFLDVREQLQFAKIWTDTT